MDKPPSYDGPAHSTDAPPCASTSPPAVEASQRTGRARFYPWSAVAPLRAELRGAGPPGLTGAAERSLAADNRFARSSCRSTCHRRTTETSPREPADRLSLTPFAGPRWPASGGKVSTGWSRREAEDLQ
jgi:hypothetical protein